ncbi:hypothetical protein PGT21_003587 [Puccinia graminis f. sp. tritici]|uniref:DUF3835 domain-containing protein n=1 Tax=Puccinia graminis f. sp. tritici TaxID=56615 RepID=A0A5B0PK98_PUCGR|nr:hypothetical protein PGT21_003587 [Puccinia graminis f. sp. tritici]
MDIQENNLEESNQLTQESNNRPSDGSTTASTGPIHGLKSDDPTGTNSYQLPSHISKLLDELELEEELELKNRPPEETVEQSQSDEEHSHTEEFISPDDIGQEIDKALNLAKPAHHACQQQDEQEDLKAWGKTGLDGLKNIFKTSALSVPSTSQQTSQQLAQSADHNPPACSAPTPTPSILARPRTDKLIPQEDSGSLKASQKKSVTFAPETYLNPPKSTSTSSPILPDPPRPSPGIMLSDIVERPIVQPTPPVVIPSRKPAQSTKIEVNGKNAYLNPRLASLLPRSLQNGSCSKPDQVAQDPTSQQEEGESSEEDQDDLDSDEDNDGSSTWSEDEDEGAAGGSSWPPEDLDIQTVLDLRQAALEYHTKRQGLGLGRGTGPLGGDRAPGSDDESEWVPLDARVKAPGVPRRSSGQSRFKTGRPLPPLDGTNPDCLGDEKVVDGKLFGAAPIIEGPAPTMGAAVHQLPGRTADFTEVDDELTAEEVELLRSRLEALGMDEERRIAAEKAGSELMAWMEKARIGEVDLEDQPRPDSEVTLDQPQRAPLAEKSFRNEGPPEIKTAPKSSALKFRPTISKNPSPIANAASVPKGTVRTEPPLDPPIAPRQNNDKVDQTSSRNGLADQVSIDSLPSSTPSTTTPSKKLSRFKASKINQNL